MKRKNTSKAVKELLSFPFRLLYSFNYQYNSKLLLDLYEEKSLSLRKALGASNENLFIFIFSQLFLCAIAASTCVICIQWIFSTLSENIVEFTSYSIS